jgi:hypothetical protein
MLCPDPLSFTDARAACDDHQMRLVRMSSGQEHTYLRFRTLQNGYPKFHIGATDSAQEGTWVWEDGTTFWSGGSGGTRLQFAMWPAGEPNNQNGDENCGEVQSVQGWNDSVCDFEAKPFVCEEYPDPLPQCGDRMVQPGEACDTGGASATCDTDCSRPACGDGLMNRAAGEACDDGGSGQFCSSDCTSDLCPPGCLCFLAAGKDYALCTTASGFGDAEVFCGSHGMALASINTAAENQALRTNASNAGIAQYWVGGTDLDAEGEWLSMDGTFFWSDVAGSALAYENFAASARTAGATLDCTRVLGNGEWSDEDCAASLAYMCERVLP